MRSSRPLRVCRRLLALRADANRTVYSRQAALWPMVGLLADLTPLPWMRTLRLNDLNVWLGDGHFRNTLHFDPYDNLLCQVRGTKHLLLYPPDAKPHLYYGRRRDIQASFSPTRGEYNRHDTGIVSENTAEVNGAAPDLAAFPQYAKALAQQSYAELHPSDCLYLPRNHHHHVFSEADPDGGYNLALNMWVDRDTVLHGAPPRPTARDERFPTLEQLVAALAAVDELAAATGRRTEALEVANEIEPARSRLAAATEDAAAAVLEASERNVEGSCVSDDG